MAKINEKRVKSCLQVYYNSPELQGYVLKELLQEVAEVTRDVRALQKVKVSADELTSEAFYALIMTINGVKFHEEPSACFEFIYLGWLRIGLRKFGTTKDFIDIDDVSIQDPNPNPEELYIMKEQIELIKGFLVDRYPREYVDMFMRHYAGGETLRHIAKDYEVTPMAVHKRVEPMLKAVRAYMERINEEG